MPSWAEPVLLNGKTIPEMPEDLRHSFLEFDVQVRRGGFSLSTQGRFDSGITAIFGPSGAGKSTLLACLSGELKPDSGMIRSGGETLFSSHDAIHKPPRSFRAAMVFQQGMLFPHMTVRKNIEYGYRLRPENDRSIAVQELIAILRLSRLLHRAPNTLSGGERQRVALARALATSPRMLLLDEPVASLDIRLRNEVLAYLKQVHEKYQIPMLYVSHSLSDIMFLATEAIILESGKVKWFGPARQMVMSAATSAGGSSTPVENIFSGTVTGPDSVSVSTTTLWAPASSFPVATDVTVSISASEIILASQRPQAISARNVLFGTVSTVNRGYTNVIVSVDAGIRLVVEVTPESATELSLQVGRQIYAMFKTSSILVTPA